MPHAVDGDSAQLQSDNDAIAALLNNDSSGRPSDALDFLTRDLDVGIKADDAIDYEDISDDDLASDRDESEAVPAEENNISQAPDEDGLFGQYDDESGRTNGEGMEHSGQDVEDLFGEEDLLFQDTQDTLASTQAAASGDLVLPSKPRIVLPGASSGHELLDEDAVFDSPATYGVSPVDQANLQLPTSSATPEPTTLDDDEEEDDEQVTLQRMLFARSAGRQGSHELPDAPETDMDLFFSVWPSYDPERTARFIDLFPPPPGAFNWKTPLKPPKPLQISKLALDIGPDTERTFRLTNAAMAAKTNRGADIEQPNTVKATLQHAEDESTTEDIEVDDMKETDLIGGVAWRDIELACCGWESEGHSSVGSPRRRKSPHADSGVYMESDSEQPESKRDFKRLKTAGAVESAMVVPTIPSLDNPEQATERLAKQVNLDMNDEGLLIDESLSRNPSKRRTLAFTKAESKDARRDLTRRYNISNDEAYELLKENHQHKIRSTLGSVAIEHSMPAVKLQYPFYKVKPEPRQLRSFHRPHLTGIRVGKEIRFSKLKVFKKKHYRRREIKELFAKSADLSMGDNSTGLLLEYSEEMPMMLSNYGMGNRLVNYYRRKDAQDSSRPKEEIGETQVLLPQDRSPFANFGYVDPGELVPAVHNGLYRAPIFRHEGKPTDFLVVSSTTGEGGSKYFLRNVENVHTVGQQFPLTEIPGEHSRKVTDAAKKRLKTISYRVWRKWLHRKGQPLTNHIVQAHLPGSEVAQNRGKMREFMKYDKNLSVWVPKDGEIPPDTEELRGLIRPEDICLLDSMQVGVQHLTDLGLRRDEDANDDDDDKEGANIELLLAPWATTKNFMNACQGKAMLQLHGEGDPTGRGEGFSFVKTSMKGGFRALGESIEERLDAKKLKENHGHSYNVAKQQRAYDESVRRIWRAQNDSLSSKVNHSDTEVDVDDQPDDHFERGGTPRTSFGTPAASRREDESVSQFSRNSASRKNQTLVITRTQRDQYGNLEEVPVTITNPRIITAYKRAKMKEQTAQIDPVTIVRTGDSDYDAMQLKAAEEELERLYHNQDRRRARERAKGIVSSPPAGSLGGDDQSVNVGNSHGITTGTGKRGGRKKQASEGTGRKCANCGQIGHIKTNKKLCPMLNGTMKPEDIHTGFGGGGGAGVEDSETQDVTNAAASTGQDMFAGMNLPGMEI